MKYPSRQLRPILSFFWSAGLISLASIVAHATRRMQSVNYALIIVGLVCIVGFVFLHTYMKQFWLRYYFEARITQALNHGSTFIMFANEPEADLKLNVFSLGLSVVAYVLSVLDIDAGVWLASTLVLAYVAVLCWLMFSYVFYRDYNTTYQNSYLAVTVMDSFHAEPQFSEQMTVAELRAAIDETFQDEKTKRRP